MKVLLVDDEDDARMLAAMVLRHVGGMEVAERPDARDVVEAAVAFRPDVILLDVMLPEIDGPTALKALQADERTRSIPVAFFTAKAMASEVERLRLAGARAVITKPFHPEGLAGQVRALLEAAPDPPAL